MRKKEAVRTYRVSYNGHSWITKRDGDLTVGIHRTQQQAIESAKRRAVDDRCRVEWEDRDGNFQGGTSYEVK